MLKRSLHIIFAVLLVFTTTASIWEHLISNTDDPIEISFEYETDAEKSEKESKKELNDWNDDLVAELESINAKVFSGLQKVGSSSFAPLDEAPKKLYILLHRLKLDC